MDRKTKNWIKMMEWFSNYWGCHQMPERSFFYKDYQFPVCARCTGIIVGGIACILSIYYIRFLNIIISFMFLIPMVADGLTQAYTKYRSNNFRRLMTGLLFGYGLISLVLNIILQVVTLLGGNSI